MTNKNWTLAALAGLTALVVIVFFFRPAVQAQDSSGLVGMWRFDQMSGLTVIDASGMGNDGYLVGAAYPVSDPKLGTALQVGDISGDFLIPHHPSLEPAVGTLQAWVFVNKLQDSDVVVKLTDYQVRTHGAWGKAVYGLRIYKSGFVSGYVMNDDPEAPGPWVYAWSNRSLLKTRKWYFLALRWDGSTVALFVNGKLVAAQPYDPVPEIGLSYHGEFDLMVAKATWWEGDDNHEFIGKLGDIRLYSVARTEAQILSDYRLFAGGN